jgi:hypothetical protein
MLPLKKCPECGTMFRPPKNCPSKIFCDHYCREKFYHRKERQSKIAHQLEHSVDL